MKKIIVIAIVIIVTLAAIGIAWPYAKTYYQQRLEQRLVHDKKLKADFNTATHTYQQTYNNMLLYACTKKIADVQGIPLSPDFYSQLQLYGQAIPVARQNLITILNQLQARYGKPIHKDVSGMLDQLDGDKTITTTNVTRGLCRSFLEETTIHKIADNVARYQTAPTKDNTIAQQQNNALYLNSRLQVVNFTTDVANRALPTTVFINDNAYPIQCRYEKVQRYESLIATNKVLLDTAYSASHYFYQHISPSINYILTCEANTPLSTTALLQFSDTYPWYQPIVIGSPDHKPAAGDALVYVNGNQLVMVLGHETCVCNSNTEEKCQQVKTLTRGYKHVAWDLLLSLGKDKANLNAAGQQATNDFLAYAENEIKNDYCYIDKTAIEEHLATMLNDVKKSAPTGMQKPEQVDERLKQDA